LAAFRISRFGDGRVVFGSSLSPAVVEGGSAHIFFAAWRRVYFDETFEPPMMDRSVVLNLPTPGVDKAESPMVL
jgi:hypothetical protein